MDKPRWTIGEPRNRGLYRNNWYAGVVETEDVAEEIVAALNKEAPNDRQGICEALSKEANRIYNKQEKDYPSNVLDVVCWNIRAGQTEYLSVRKHPSGQGLESLPPKTS